MKNMYAVAALSLAIIALSVMYATRSSDRSSAYSPSPSSTIEGSSALLPLTGTEWVWLHTELFDGGLVSTPARESYILKFDASGKVTGSTECNSFGASYTKNEPFMIIRTISSTEKACKAAIEATYLTELGKVSSVQFLGDRMYLYLRDDAGRMVFGQK
jgi:heat shock protein HslJ